jgi:hypothetical protein
MNFRSVIIPALALCFFMNSSCGPVKGTGDIVTQDRTVKSFTAIDLSSAITATIHVQPGATPSVTISTYKNIADLIETKVEGNTLSIGTENFTNISLDRDIMAEITVPSLTALSVHGSGEAKVLGVIAGNGFDLDISGSGEVDLQSLQLASFSVSISGVGNVNVTGGVAYKTEYSVSGSGSVHSFGLQSDDAEVGVSGSGDVELTANKTLDADISGSGTVRYRGHPQLKSDVSGAGNIAEAN